MRGILIQALTEKGTQALRKHEKDKSKSSVKDRFLYKQTFKEVVVDDTDGLKLILLAKHRYFLPESMKPIAQEMMISNGAVEDVDFTITFYEEAEK